MMPRALLSRRVARPLVHPTTDRGADGQSTDGSFPSTGALILATAQAYGLGAILWLGIALAACLVGCTDADRTRDTLRKAGFRNIATGGYAWFSCDDKSDQYATEFRATNPAGETVEGVVCCGILKGCTVRF